MTISDEKLQRAVNLCLDKDNAEVARILNVSIETISRYLREARERGMLPEEEKEPDMVLPKILVFDLENAPSKAAVWRMWKQNINNEQITEEWYMLSWSVKWLFGGEIYSDVLTPEEAKEGSDKRIMESLWEYIDYADILIGHNINQFDVLKMNTRFVVNGLIPPSPYQTVDTLLAARKNFSFTSNKLDYLCKQFGVARKADKGGLQRWLDCCDGVPQALIDMEAYNRQDIIATEELYLAMRGWIKTHPNLALYLNNDTDLCYKCGSSDIKWLYEENGDPKYYYTNVNKYHSYRCNIEGCRSIGRSRFSAYNKGDRKHITSPIAR